MKATPVPADFTYCGPASGLRPALVKAVKDAHAGTKTPAPLTPSQLYTANESLPFLPKS